MIRIARRTAAFALAGTGLVVFAGVGIASAHVDTDPIAIEAGQPATVGFVVGHGCSGSNTVALDIKIPTNVTDAKPVDASGWTSSVDASGVIHFSGGNLDSHTSQTFSISFTAPTTAGRLDFPTVQKCVQGENDWIDIAAEGQPEPANPAPSVLVTAGPPTAAELTPPPEDATDATATVQSTVAGVTTTVAAKKSDNSKTGLIVGVIIGVIVIGGGAAAAAVARRKKSAGNDSRSTK